MTYNEWASVTYIIIEPAHLSRLDMNGCVAVIRGPCLDLLLCVKLCFRHSWCILCQLCQLIDMGLLSGLSHAAGGQTWIMNLCVSMCMCLYVGPCKCMQSHLHLLCMYFTHAHINLLFIKKVLLFIFPLLWSFLPAL